MRFIAKAIFLTLALGIVSACAQGARPTALVAEVTNATLLPEGSPLAASVEVGTVSGGEETNPAWKSNVSTEAFETALNQSLAVTALLAPQGGPLKVDAELIELDQPIVGLSMTVTSTARYMVTDAAGATVFDETIITPHTAEFSEAFLGVERLRLANEGSMKKNISRFIELLIEQSEADPAKFS
ncbi:MAG: hypothetical protein AAGC79_17400 [Pseudomonadota bacterium]